MLKKVRALSRVVTTRVGSAQKDIMDPFADILKYELRFQLVEMKAVDTDFVSFSISGDMPQISAHSGLVYPLVIAGWRLYAMVQDRLHRPTY